MKKLLPLLPLALLLSACTEEGYPSTDVEMTVTGIILCVLIICVAAVFIARMRS